MTAAISRLCFNKAIEISTTPISPGARRKAQRVTAQGIARGSYLDVNRASNVDAASRVRKPTVGPPDHRHARRLPGSRRRHSRSCSVRSSASLRVASHSNRRTAISCTPQRHRRPAPITSIGYGDRRILGLGIEKGKRAGRAPDRIRRGDIDSAMALSPSPAPIRSIDIIELLPDAPKARAEACSHRSTSIRPPEAVPSPLPTLPCREVEIEPEPASCKSCVCRRQ